MTSAMIMSQPVLPGNITQFGEKQCGSLTVINIWKQAPHQIHIGPFFLLKQFFPNFPLLEE